MTFVALNLACGEARGGRIPGHGAVTDEQRSHRPNSAQPGGRQVFFAQTSLLAPYRSTAGYARRSRLVWAKNPLPRTSSYLCRRPLSLGSVPDHVSGLRRNLCAGFRRGSIQHLAVEIISECSGLCADRSGIHPVNDGDECAGNSTKGNALTPDFGGG